MHWDCSAMKFTNYSNDNVEISELLGDTQLITGTENVKIRVNELRFSAKNDANYVGIEYFVLKFGDDCRFTLPANHTKKKFGYRQIYAKTNQSVKTCTKVEKLEIYCLLVDGSYFNPVIEPGQTLTIEISSQ